MGFILLSGLWMVRKSTAHLGEARTGRPDFLLSGALTAFCLLLAVLSLAIGIVPDRAEVAAARIAIAAGVSVIAAPLTLGAVADQVGIRAAFGPDHPLVANG